MTYHALILSLKGSSSSGNHGHAGRKGLRGGSAPGSSSSFTIPINQSAQQIVMTYITRNNSATDIDKALNVLKNFVKNAPVSIRVPEDVLPQILEDGRFKNQHETGTSRGMLDSEYRKVAERNAFGINQKKPTDFPIYGYISTGVNGHRPPVQHYGDVRVVLNDDVKNRTTITAQDSLSPFSNLRGAPSPLLDPKAVSLNSDVDTYASYGRPPDYNYVEAQIHGGITVKDIKHVYFPDTPSNRDSLVPALTEAGIPHTLIPAAQYGWTDLENVE
jgi:hypothetical protein